MLCNRLNISLSYTSFGMLMPGRHWEDANTKYRIGFQGQENDRNIKGNGNSVNFSYRMHDPRTGRFFAVDPLAPVYPHNSSYAFGENRVVDKIELEGLEKGKLKRFFGRIIQRLVTSTQTDEIVNITWNIMISNARTIKDGVNTTVDLSGTIGASNATYTTWGTGDIIQITSTVNNAVLGGTGGAAISTPLSAPIPIPANTQDIRTTGQAGGALGNGQVGSKFRIDVNLTEQIVIREVTTRSFGLRIKRTYQIFAGDDAIRIANNPNNSDLTGALNVYNRLLANRPQDLTRLINNRERVVGDRNTPIPGISSGGTDLVGSGDPSPDINVNYTITGVAPGAQGTAVTSGNQIGQIPPNR